MREVVQRSVSRSHVHLHVHVNVPLPELPSDVVCEERVRLRSGARARSRGA
jgi:hypothetical protein